MAVEIDDLDKRILHVLSKNSRLSQRAIAKKVDVSVATALNRVKQLEQDGVILGYGARIDYEKAGYELGVVVHVRVSRGKLFEVEKKIALDPHVIALYDITGGFDAIVIARFKNRRGLDAFLKKIQAYEFVGRTETVLILNEIMERTLEIA